jgi:hypothetical protein
MSMKNLITKVKIHIVEEIHMIPRKNLLTFACRFHSSEIREIFVFQKYLLYTITAIKAISAIIKVA